MDSREGVGASLPGGGSEGGGAASSATPTTPDGASATPGGPAPGGAAPGGQRQNQWSDIEQDVANYHIAQYGETKLRPLGDLNEQEENQLNAGASISGGVLPPKANDGKYARTYQTEIDGKKKNVTDEIAIKGGIVSTLNRPDFNKDPDGFTESFRQDIRTNATRMGKDNLTLHYKGCDPKDIPPKEIEAVLKGALGQKSFIKFSEEVEAKLGLMEQGGNKSEMEQAASIRALQGEVNKDYLANKPETVERANRNNLALHQDNLDKLGSARSELDSVNKDFANYDPDKDDLTKLTDRLESGIQGLNRIVSKMERDLTNTKPEPGMAHKCTKGIESAKTTLGKSEGLLGDAKEVLQQNAKAVSMKLDDAAVEARVAQNPDREIDEHMNHAGKVAVLGFLPKTTNIDWSVIIMRGISIKGIYGREMYDTWYKMITMLQSGLNITPVITHEFSYLDYQRAFDTVRSGESGKVVMNWK